LSSLIAYEYLKQDVLMIIKHLIVSMGVLLLITLHITTTVHLPQSDGIKDAIFDDILNNNDNSFTTITITNPTNKSNMTAKDSTIALRNLLQSLLARPDHYLFLTRTK
jgi:hypothetical protein